MTLQTITRGAQVLTISVIAAALMVEAPVTRAGQGKGGPKPPREVPATATFGDVLSGIEGDGDQYVDGDLNGGWAHFVANGNFTLRTYGNSKKKNSDPPRELNVTLSPVLGSTPIPGPAFLAVDDSHCPTGSCTVIEEFEFSTEEGLRDMGQDDKIFVQINGRMADLANPGVTILWRCGAQPRADETVDYTDTEYFEARCENSDQGTCIQWRVSPDLDDPAASPRKCSVFVEDGGGNVTRVPGLADVEIDLVIDRQ